MQPTASPESIGLGTRVPEYMTRNRFAGDLADTGLERFNETTSRGAGVGPGFAAAQGPARTAVACQRGRVPVRRRRELRVLIHQALIDWPHRT